MKKKSEATAAVPSALAVVDEQAARETAADVENTVAAWAMYREILGRELDKAPEREDGPALVEIMKDLNIDRKQVKRDLETLSIVRQHVAAAADPAAKREAAAAARARWSQFLKDNEELCRTTRREIDAIIAADDQAFYGRERLRVLKQQHPELLADLPFPE